MTTNLLPISSDGGFVTAGNITTASYASPAPTISGFSTVSSDNFRLMAGNITSGIATVVDDGINSIALALGAQMDVYGFPFSQTTRGQLTISGVATPSEVNGTWYYQSVNTNTYQIYTDSTYSTLVDATGWSAYTGGGEVAILKQVPAANITIDTNGYFSKFDNTGNLTIPGNLLLPNNAYISATNATGAVAGKTINIQAGAADQTDYYTTAGGNLNLIGGLGAGNDGGGGGPGGSVNITSGASADVAGHNGNVTINTGGDDPWTFGYDGILYVPGNITVATAVVASPAPFINGFSSITLEDNVHIGDNFSIFSTGNIVFTSNIYMSNGYVISSLDDIGGQVDYNNRTVGYVADNNGSASLYARDSAGLGDNNAVITANATNGTVTLLAANAALSNKTWTFDGAGNLTLPANTFAINYANGTQVSLGGGSISNISNGNSNVNIATANGNVTIAAVGNTTMTITGTGANITGTANISGNLVAGNLMGPLANGNSNVTIATSAGNVVTNVNGAMATTVSASGIQVGGLGRLLSPGGAASVTLNNNGANIPILGVTSTATSSTTTSGALIVSGGVGIAGNIVTGGQIVRTTTNMNAPAWGSNGAGLVLNAANFNDITSSAGTQATSYVHVMGSPTLSYISAVTITNATTLYVDKPIAGSNATLGNVWAIIANGAVSASGNVNAGNLVTSANVSAGNVNTANLSATGNITGNTSGFAIGYRDVPQVSLSANTQIGLTNAGKHFYSTNSGNLVLTIPNALTLDFPIGTAISIVVQSTGNVLVNAIAGVSLFLAGNSTAANRVIGGYGMATIMKVASDTWFINGTGVS